MSPLLKIVRIVASSVADRGTADRRDPQTHPELGDRDDLPVPVGCKSNVESDVRTLKFLYEDARRVVDHQIGYLGDVDDKAVRTVRITAVIVGVVLSAHQLSSQVSLTDPLLGVAVLLLLASMGVGIVTYTTSDAQFGPGPRYIDDVLDKPADETYWRFETLRSYADWIEDNEHVTRRNGTYLLVSQLLLLVGLTTLTTGIAIELITRVRW